MGFCIVVSTTRRTSQLACFYVLWSTCLFAQQPIGPTRQPGDMEIYARSQESVGEMRYLRGNVEIQYNDSILTAEEIDYNDRTDDIEARGNVRYRNSVKREDLHAEKFNYNLRTEVGTFYRVHGTVASANQGGFRVLTTDNPFYIDGKVVHKTANHYTVHNGYVTNCEITNPWWTMRAPRTKITPSESATVYRGVFRVRKVPIFYFPVFKKSLERLPRQSGFLTPNIGNSSRFGFVLGQSYYWAINRNYDATIGGTWYTDRGVASQVGVRGRPTENSHFNADFFGVKDRGRKLDDGRRIKQGGRSFSMQGSALMPGGFRGVAEINYLSSLEFRQAFTQSFQEAVFSQVRSFGFITKNFSTFSINTELSRDENFQSVERGDTIIVRKLPSVEFNSRDRPLVDGPVPLWFSLDSSFGLVSRTQPLFQTRRFVQRGDLYPRLSTKFFFKGFHFRPTFGARQTAYGQSRVEGELSGANYYRSTREASIEISPPGLQRIYNGPKWLGDRVKHVIEPRLSYRYVDGADDFHRVIRFDDLDLTNNTNEAQFMVTNRFFAKNDQSGQVREVFAVDIWQRRYFDRDFGGALLPGRRNVLRSTIDFSPFAFADQLRSYSPIATAMRVRPSWRYGLEWRYDYDPLRGKLVNSGVTGDFRVNRFLRTSVGHYAVRTPSTVTPPSNQLFTKVSLGDFNRRGWNVAVSNIYDYRQKIFLYTIAQVAYNTDCCGFSVGWRRFAIGTIRNENQIRVSLSIANVGSFGTLASRERLF